MPGGFGNGVGPLLLAVALVDVYFFVHVVQALTPGGLAIASRPPRGLRSSREIARTDREAYARAWQAVGRSGGAPLTRRLRRVAQTA